jgi:ABC-type sugar transport system substrate-binding protein
MNAVEKDNMKCFGDYLCKRWVEILEQAPGCWDRREEKQAFQDTLQALKHFDFIKDYNLESGVVINEERVVSCRKKFIAKGKAVPL